MWQKKRSPPKPSVAKAKIATEDKLQEENAYQRKLQRLQDHGEPDKDEPLKNSEDESDNWRSPVGAVHSIHNISDEIYECFASTAQLLRPRKKAKLTTYRL